MIATIIPTLKVTLLVTIRLGAVLLFSPLQAIRQLPTHVRLLLVLGLSGLLVSNLSLAVTDSNEIALLAGAVAELGNGLILSMSLFAAFTFLQIAGQLIDSQMGLNSLAIFNPSERSHDPLTSRLLTMFAVLFFFATSGHYWLVQGLAYSFIILPPGKLALFKGFTAIIRQFSLMFIMGLMLASPIMISLLLIDLCAGVITRNMPQVSTYFLILPIKILLGLFLFILTLNYLTPLLQYGFNQCFHSWKEVMS